MRTATTESLHHGLPAADVHSLSGDAAGSIRGDIGDQLGDLLGFEKSSDRHGGDRLGFEFLWCDALKLGGLVDEQVSTQPGQMVLTVMPRLTTSRANARVKPIMPCLVVQ